MSHKKLILHIGAHKTGTTTLQNWLFENNDLLAKHDMTYVIAGPHRHLHAALGFVDPDNLVPHGAQVVQSDRIVQALNTGQTDTVIACAENFSFFFERGPIAALHDLLKPHVDEIQIVTYLRRQDAHAVSHYQEGAKPDRRAEEQLFGHALTALPPADAPFDLYLDYERRVGLWIDVFGAQNVTVRVFDRNTLVGGDVVSDFMDVMGLPAPDLDKVEEHNVSLGFSAATVGRMMNARGMGVELKDRVLSHIPDDPKLIPSADQARAFYAPYRDSNIRLNARLGNTAGDDLFSDDFSAYPDTPRDRWAHPQSDAVISVLLDELARYGHLPVDTIREAAEQAHAGGNGPLALKLIQAAAILRPTGPYIQKLLGEYRALYGTKAP